MDSIHDLGGKEGYGQVAKEDREPAFHARWEASVFAMAAAGRSAGAWHNTDRFRHAIERTDPVAYLTHRYYGRWLGGIENMLVEAGVLSTHEIDAKTRSLGGKAEDLVASRPDPNSAPLGPAPSAQGSARQEIQAAAFSVGDRVVTRSTPSRGHTRLPGYARGKTGHIKISHGTWVYPDSNAHGEGENPQHLYTVEFSADELWGDSGDTGASVCIDLFEPYLNLAARTDP